MSKEKSLKEKKKLSLKKIIILFISSIIIICLGIIIAKITVYKVSENINGQIMNIKMIEDAENIKDYTIEAIGKIKFKNVCIQIKDNISYINIDIINNEKKDIKEQNIIVKLTKEDKQKEILYKIPKIESKKFYRIELMSTGDLTKYDKIEIENLKI